MSFTTPWGGMEDRRADIARVNGVIGGDFTVAGHGAVLNSGEAQFDILFGVRFIEIPAFSFGFSLDDGETWDVGEMPTVSAVVGSWVFGRKSTGQRFYDGATILLVTTGRAALRGQLHYQFSGRAITL